MLRQALPALAMGLAACAAPALAAPTTLCVWDPIGAGGPLFDAAKGYALAMSANGVTLTPKPYTDEQVAAEDFRVGQCDALLATSLRTKVYNPVTASMDVGGAVTIVRDGRLDLDATQRVIHKALQVLAAPGAAALNVQGRYEIGGIIPTGAVYLMMRDKTILQKGFAGARMPAFDHDKSQAYMIAKIGAVPVSADTRNFANKFNNGLVDVIFAPAVAYQPLELSKGVGTQGGVSRFPLTFTSMQLVLQRQSFPEDFGQKSRQYWLDQHDAIAATVRKAEAAIPAKVWVDYPPEQVDAFVASQRDLRIELASKGFYNKQGLKFMKRVRCSVHAQASECSAPTETE